VKREIYEHCIGEGDRPIEEVVGEMLAERRLTLSAAESCSGGLLSKRITDVPGSSRYFLGSIVSYSNEAKENVLGVARETLMFHGAVSEETAVEMAARARQTFSSSIAISITGIAGPGGGTEEKPVGRVYVCLLAGGEEPVVACNDFIGDREAVRMRSVNKALSMLFHYLREKK
jgi:PncC family amidohydrolase